MTGIQFLSDVEKLIKESEASAKNLKAAQQALSEQTNENRKNEENTRKYLESILTNLTSLIGNNAALSSLKTRLNNLKFFLDTLGACQNDDELLGKFSTRATPNDKKSLPSNSGLLGIFNRTQNNKSSSANSYSISPFNANALYQAHKSITGNPIDSLLLKLSTVLILLAKSELFNPLYDFFSERRYVKSNLQVNEKNLPLVKLSEIVFFLDKLNDKAIEGLIDLQTDPNQRFLLKTIADIWAFSKMITCKRSQDMGSVAALSYYLSETSNESISQKPGSFTNPTDNFPGSNERAKQLLDSPSGLQKREKESYTLNELLLENLTALADFNRFQLESKNKVLLQDILNIRKQYYETLKNLSQQLGISIHKKLPPLSFYVEMACEQGGAQVLRTLENYFNEQKQNIEKIKALQFALGAMNTTTTTDMSAPNAYKNLNEKLKQWGYTGSDITSESDWINNIIEIIRILSENDPAFTTVVPLDIFSEPIPCPKNNPLDPAVRADYLLLTREQELVTGNMEANKALGSLITYENFLEIFQKTKQKTKTDPNAEHAFFEELSKKYGELYDEKSSEWIKKELGESFNNKTVVEVQTIMHLVHDFTKTRAALLLYKICLNLNIIVENASSDHDASLFQLFFASDLEPNNKERILEYAKSQGLNETITTELENTIEITNSIKTQLSKIQLTAEQIPYLRILIEHRFYDIAAFVPQKTYIKRKLVADDMLICKFKTLEKTLAQYWQDEKTTGKDKLETAFDLFKRLQRDGALQNPTQLILGELSIEGFSHFLPDWAAKDPTILKNAYSNYLKENALAIIGKLNNDKSAYSSIIEDLTSGSQLIIRKGDSALSINIETALYRLIALSQRNVPMLATPKEFAVAKKVITQAIKDYFSGNSDEDKEIKEIKEINENITALILFINWNKSFPYFGPEYFETLFRNINELVELKKELNRGNKCDKAKILEKYLPKYLASIGGVIKEALKECQPKLTIEDLMSINEDVSNEKYAESEFKIHFRDPNRIANALTQCDISSDIELLKKQKAPKVQEAWPPKIKALDGSYIQTAKTITKQLETTSNEVKKKQLEEQENQRQLFTALSDNCKQTLDETLQIDEIKSWDGFFNLLTNTEEVNEISQLISNAFHGNSGAAQLGINPQLIIDLKKNYESLNENEKLQLNLLIRLFALSKVGAFSQLYHSLHKAGHVRNISQEVDSQWNSDAMLFEVVCFLNRDNDLGIHTDVSKILILPDPKASKEEQTRQIEKQREILCLVKATLMLSNRVAFEQNDKKSDPESQLKVFKLASFIADATDTDKNSAIDTWPTNREKFLQAFKKFESASRSSNATKAYLSQCAGRLLVDHHQTCSPETALTSEKKFKDVLCTIIETRACYTANPELTDITPEIEKDLTRIIASYEKRKNSLLPIISNENDTGKGLRKIIPTESYYLIKYFENTPESDQTRKKAIKELIKQDFERIDRDYNVFQLNQKIASLMNAPSPYIILGAKGLNLIKKQFENKKTELANQLSNEIDPKIRFRLKKQIDTLKNALNGEFTTDQFITHIHTYLQVVAPKTFSTEQHIALDRLPTKGAKNADGIDDYIQYVDKKASDKTDVAYTELLKAWGSNIFNTKILPLMLKLTPEKFLERLKVGQPGNPAIPLQKEDVEWMYAQFKPVYQSKNLSTTLGMLDFLHDTSKLPWIIALYELLKDSPYITNYSTNPDKKLAHLLALDFGDQSLLSYIRKTAQKLGYDDAEGIATFRSILDTLKQFKELAQSIQLTKDEQSLIHNVIDAHHLSDVLGYLSHLSNPFDPETKHTASHSLICRLRALNDAVEEFKRKHADLYGNEDQTEVKTAFDLINATINDAAKSNALQIILGEARMKAIDVYLPKNTKRSKKGELRRELFTLIRDRISDTILKEQLKHSEKLSEEEIEKFKSRLFCNNRLDALVNEAMRITTQASFRNRPLLNHPWQYELAREFFEKAYQAYKDANFNINQLSETDRGIVFYIKQSANADFERIYSPQVFEDAATAMHDIFDKLAEIRVLSNNIEKIKQLTPEDNQEELINSLKKEKETLKQQDSELLRDIYQMFMPVFFARFGQKLQAAVTSKKLEGYILLDDLTFILKDITEWKEKLNLEKLENVLKKDKQALANYLADKTGLLGKWEERVSGKTNGMSDEEFTGKAAYLEKKIPSSTLSFWPPALGGGKLYPSESHGSDILPTSTRKLSNH